MGEAKRRGTYEERKEIAVKRYIAYLNEKELERRRIEISKTPEDRAREMSDRALLMQMMLLLGMSGYLNSPNKFRL